MAVDAMTFIAILAVDQEHPVQYSTAPPLHHRGILCVSTCLP